MGGITMKTFAFETWGSPEEAGVSSAGILRFLDEWEKVRKTIQLHSLIVLRHGKIVWKMNVAPYSDRTVHTMYSLSKSFTSAAAGFAVSEGLLRWDDSVVDILPEEVPEGREDVLRPITLEALLCMGSGLDKASDSPSPDPAVTWARHVLSHEVQYPVMTHFSYNSFGTYLVSCMIQKVTGQTVRDYLIPRLFAPLGIETPEWDQSPEGISCGGFGLHLATESIARFGQCLLQRGKWQGKQVLPEGWVELATREHIANYEGHPQEGNEWGQGYGFQFWRCIGGRYRGDGAMGQGCFVDERQDMVIAVTCGTNDLGGEFGLIREYLFGAPEAAPGDAAAQETLRQRTEALHWGGPEDDGTDGDIPEGVYTSEFQGMTVGLRIEKLAGERIRLAFSFGEDRLNLELPRSTPGPAGEQRWQGTVLHFIGAWGRKDGKLSVSLRDVNGPETLEGTFAPAEGGLTFEGLGVDCPDGGSFYRKVAE